MIGSLGIQVLGATEVAQKIAGLPRLLHAAEVKSVNQMVVKGESIFRRKVSGPVLKVQTGAYRSSISRQFAETMGSGAIEGKVGVAKGPASPYAKIHETGGVIVPKNKPALVFKIGDRWVRTMRVVIPARRPLGQTLDEIRPLMAATFDAEVRKATGSV